MPPQRRGVNCKSIGESIANRWEGLEDSRKNKIVAYLHVIPECLNRESSGFDLDLKVLSQTESRATGFPIQALGKDVGVDHVGF